MCVVICKTCKQALPVTLPRIEHEIIKCLECGTFHFVISGEDSPVCIKLNDCPAEFRRFLQWSEKELDELEFLTLLSFLRDLPIWSN